MVTQILDKVERLKEEIVQTNTRSYPLKAATQQDWINKLQEIANDLRKVPQTQEV